MPASTSVLGPPVPAAPAAGVAPTPELAAKISASARKTTAASAAAAAHHLNTGLLPRSPAGESHQVLNSPGAQPMQTASPGQPEDARNGQWQLAVNDPGGGSAPVTDGVGRA